MGGKYIMNTITIAATEGREKESFLMNELSPIPFLRFLHTTVEFQQGIHLPPGQAIVRGQTITTATLHNYGTQDDY